MQSVHIIRKMVYLVIQMALWICPLSPICGLVSIFVVLCYSIFQLAPFILGWSSPLLYIKGVVSSYISYEFEIEVVFGPVQKYVPLLQMTPRTSFFKQWKHLRHSSVLAVKMKLVTRQIFVVLLLQFLAWLFLLFLKPVSFTQAQGLVEYDAVTQQ